ncbi:MAG: aryl-sulfate sulfotransferase [Steroidobacteraceae bacterium]
MQATARRVLVLSAMFLTAGQMAAAPSVFPTGLIVDERGATWGGYTVLSRLQAPYVVVLDMNGKIVKQWDGFNTSAGGPARIVPGGNVIATSGANPGHQESTSLVAQDFSGKELWRLDRNVTITQADGKQVNSLRQHHDWQRSDFPSGYYSPASTPSATAAARTLFLTHVNRVVPAIGPGELEDDRLIEMDADGKITWEWRAGDHIDEFGFDADARKAIRISVTPGQRGASAGAAAAGEPAAEAQSAGPAAGGARAGGRGGAARTAARGIDWFHTNSATWLGPNKWFDAGDRRFAPDNVIISSRNSGLLVIIGRDGKIVWRMGPDFRATPELLAIGQISGQHHAHLIPKGLPGESNLLVFDNGGASGYGAPTPMAPQGMNISARATSRVMEIDPVTMKRVWMYNATGFYSTNISGAQRLPNGNTLITEGAGGRVFEVTTAGKIVWEYLNTLAPNGRPGTIYRAYRVPYGWIPQLPQQ